MIKFTLAPYDVLFFGSGRPFNRGDVVASIFPPHPTTFAGAICSKIRSHKNIDTSSILKNVYGPFIQKQGEIYFPKPQNIYGKRKRKKVEEVFVVKPIDKNLKLKLFDPINTNKPSELETLPVYKGEEEVEPFMAFISLGGLKKWLNNEEINKDDILQYGDIFEDEPRVGISIEPSYYSVGGSEDALYRVNFLRLKEDVEFVFWVEFNFADLELQKVNLNDEDSIVEIFNIYPKVVKLGGEMKNARYEVEKDDFISWIRKDLGIKDNLEIKKGDKVRVLFLTYGVFDFQGNGMPKIDGFKINSACFENYEIVGIKSRDKDLGTKTKRAFPLGTVMWLEATKEMRINNPAFIVKGNGDSYEIDKPKGKQEFIGSNLILIRECKTEDVNG